MISLYKDNGELLTTVALSEAPLQSVQDAKKFILEACIVSFEEAVLVGAGFAPIKDAGELPKLKFAVLLKNIGDEVDLSPITFYVRRTDKKGMKLTLSPFTSIQQLNLTVEDKMGIPPLSQELYFNGSRLEEPTDTLKLLQVKNQRIIHIVDRRFIYVDLDAPYKVYLQGPQHAAELVALQVRGKMSLAEFKNRAAEAMNLQPESTIIAYCSQVLEDTEQNLFGLSFTENAIVKILDEKSAFIQHFSHKEEDDTFIKRQNKALAHFPPRDPKIGQKEDIRMANSVVWQESNNISILNSEVYEKSYMESFRINESVSYEETYNRALKANYTKKGDSPARLVEQFPNTARSVNEIPENASDKEGSSVLINTEQTSDQKIGEFTIKIQDLLGSGKTYTLSVSQIDTIKDIKNKFESLHPSIIEGHNLLFEGRTLDDTEVAKDLGLKEEAELTMMPCS